MRALDHIVWPARDLDALAETFRRLGFQVGRRNRHPWGTVNNIIQFESTFLELLGFAEDYQAVPSDDPASPFTAFCDRFLRGASSGAAMLALRSDDAEADARSFAADGIGHGHLLPFSRAAQGPDGSDRTVSFTVAFADLPGLPDLGAFICQQHRPENFWNAAAQRHANSATGIVAVGVALRNPVHDAEPLRTFASQRPGAASAEGHSIPLAGGVIDIVDPAAARGGGRPGIASISVAVGDEAAVGRVLVQAGIPFAAAPGRLVVAAAETGGTELAFVTR